MGVKKLLGDGAAFISGVAGGGEWAIRPGRHWLYLRHCIL